MPKSKIEWTEHTINPVKGYCPNKDCPLFLKGCYAHNLYNRFGWDKQIRYEHEVWYTLPAKPSRIFVGSTIELFGEWVEDDWMDRILGQCSLIYPQHTFIFLTKKPENLIKWSPFPENCWIGISASNFTMYGQGIFSLGQIEASVKFISFEPLLSNITGNIGAYGPYTSEMMAQDFKSYTGIDWVIIGQQTPVRSSTMPKVEWIREIVQAADQADIPVFLKDNISSVFEKGLTVDKIRKQNGYFLDSWAGKTTGAFRYLRQEFPKVKVCVSGTQSTENDHQSE